MSLHGKRKLNKPFRTPSASKKFGVYVRKKKNRQNPKKLDLVQKV
ncbi:MAG: hypothetical protein CM15mV87_150 [Caudoviricetes sp.]|nr:MAG: hypothetical protein CM15mV87_150 [Caudoviricetes sp.]